MASSSLTVTTKSGGIRVYGGTGSDVRGMKRRYENMTLKEFLAQHPIRTEEDYRTMKLSTRFHKS